MRLSAEIFDLIVSTLCVQSPQDTDKRRAQRTRLRAKVTVFSCHNDDIGFPVEVLVKDLSHSGMSVEHDQPVPKGSELIATLPQMGDKPLLMRCSVMYCRSQPSGRHQLGLAFEQPLQVMPGRHRAAG
jgi:hypothetical protein